MRTKIGYLSIAMRDVLLDHIDGTPCPYRTSDDRRNHSTKALVARGLIIMGDNDGRGGRRLNPEFTIITTKGREVLAEVLADYADALERARDFIDGQPPSRQMERVLVTTFLRPTVLGDF